MADLLILNFNDSFTTIQLIDTIASYKSIDHVLVVDNNSTDDSIAVLQKKCKGKVELIKTDKNGGYGYGNNYGVLYLKRKYNSKFVVIANPDVIFSEESVIRMETFLNSNPSYALIAPVMHDKTNNRTLNFGWNIPKKSTYIIEMGLLGSKIASRKRPKFDFTKTTIDLDAVAGSLLMVNTDSFVEAGCYDENVFLYCEETILGFRFKKSGFYSAVLSNISYIHNHSVSISKTFKSIFKRRKLMIKSKLYVLKQYYRANFLEMFFARVIAFFSLVETFLLSPFKK